MLRGLSADARKELAYRAMWYGPQGGWRVLVRGREAEDRECQEIGERGWGRATEAVREWMGVWADFHGFVDVLGGEGRCGKVESDAPEGRRNGFGGVPGGKAFAMLYTHMNTLCMYDIIIL